MLSSSACGLRVLPTPKPKLGLLPAVTEAGLDSFKAARIGGEDMNEAGIKAFWFTPAAELGLLFILSAVVAIEEALAVASAAHGYCETNGSEAKSKDDDCGWSMWGKVWLFAFNAAAEDAEEEDNGSPSKSAKARFN